MLRNRQMQLRMPGRLLMRRKTAGSLVIQRQSRAIKEAKTQIKTDARIAAGICCMMGN